MKPPPVRIKALARHLQTFAPRLKPLRFRVQNGLYRLFRRCHDRDYEALGSLCPTPSLALDVGAHYGQSITSFRILWPEVEIVAFEPLPHLAARLRRLYRRDPRIRIEAVALADRSGRARFFVPRYRSYAFDGLASLDRECARSWLNADTLLAFDPAKLALDSFDVPVATLDSYGLSPDVVKIDVQGAEFAVIRGAVATLARSRPVLLIEGVEPALLAFLEAQGYRAAVYEQGRLRFDALGARNTLFVPEERLPALAGVRGEGAERAA